MKKRILLGGCDIPGWGGAATCQYQLFDRMQRDGCDVISVSLIREIEEGLHRRVWGNDFLNPRLLQNVHGCVLEEPLWRRHQRLTSLIESLQPDLLVGFGAIATVLLKLAAPRLPIVFLTIGSHQVQLLIESGVVKDFANFQRLVGQGVRFPVHTDSPERQAAQVSDLIVVHSPLVRFAFDHFSPGLVGKVAAHAISFADFIYPDAARFATFQKPFAERDIDLIFIASSWNRPIKNYQLIEDIVSRNSGLTTHVVGDCERRHPRGHYHGVVTARENLYALLGRSKTLACPSLVDAAPGVLFEASAMGCNVVASPNCGNWGLCNDQLLAQDCSNEEFSRKIEAARAASYSDNRTFFHGGYDHLLEILGGI